MKYEVHDVSLVVVQPDRSNRKALFKWPIVQVVEASDDVLVVRVEPTPGTIDNCNVFGVASDARVLWQVADRDHMYDDSPYTGLLLVNENVLLSNWDGATLLVNTKTGDVIHESQGR